MRSKSSVSEPRLCCALSIGMALLLMIVSGNPAFGDGIPSDTITFNIKGINSNNDANKPDTITMTIPEVVGNDGVESGESKLIIDLSTAKGFIGNDGYILLCEPPLNPFGGCGPKNDFKGVSDILAKGKQSGNNNKPGYFFFSDPFSTAAPNDASAQLKSLFGVTDINKVPNPLGPIDGTLETGQAQELGKLFGFQDPKAIIITSDGDPPPNPKPGTIPEPGGFTLLTTAVGTVGLLARRQRGSAGNGISSQRPN